MSLQPGFIALSAENCAPSRDHGGFWAWRRAHSGQRDGASACFRRRGHHSPTRTRYSKVRSPVQRRQLSLDLQSDARSQILLRGRIAPKVILNVVFNVVAGMILIGAHARTRCISAPSIARGDIQFVPRSDEDALS